MIQIKTISYGKCIISGEHSCVYGEPAITTCLSAHMQVKGLYERRGPKSELKLLLQDPNYKNLRIVMGVTEFIQFITIFVEKELELNELDGLLSTAFEDRDVMGPCMAFSLVLRKVFNSIPKGTISMQEFSSFVGEFNCLLSIENNIPVGKGMGSSAAFITSVMLNYYVELTLSSRER